MSRAVTEVFLAHRIEMEFGSKRRLLELFVNLIYFGEGYYGIAAASEGYFGKKAKDLTVCEAATLAGVIRNPCYRSPRKDPDSCKRARDYLLNLMMQEGCINREEMISSQRSPVTVVEKKILSGKSVYIVEKVRHEAVDLIGVHKVNSVGGYVIDMQKINRGAPLRSTYLISTIRDAAGNTVFQRQSVKATP